MSCGSMSPAQRRVAPGAWFPQFRPTRGPVEAPVGVGRAGMGAWVILAIIVLNAVIGFYQEFNAEKSIAALKKLTAPEAKVRRDGRVISIPATGIVTGDILALEAGDLVAADARLLSAASLYVLNRALFASLQGGRDLQRGEGAVGAQLEQARLDPVSPERLDGAPAGFLRREGILRGVQAEGRRRPRSARRTQVAALRSDRRSTPATRPLRTC
jgi:hypothetical protein